MKSCKQCHAQFEVTSRDKKFLQKISPVINDQIYQIPEPTLCPSCRTQRRFTFRNERNLYKTKSTLSGKELLSNLHPDTPWKIYDREEWFGDSWNGIDFGRPYDFNQPFFKQFFELQKDVPILNLNTVNNENCSFCNYVATSKNCYLIFGSVYCEECYYGNPYYSHTCIDSLLIRDSELCYQCITCKRCYECFFCQDCVGCKNLIMCYDCHNCTDCIGCIGLRNQHYRIFNKQYSKKEYEQLIPKIIEQMKNDGMWGEFFNPSLSYFHYNETVAQEYFSLTKEQTQAQSLSWREPNPKEYQKQTSAIPQEITQVPDSIINEILACSECGKNYKLIRQELFFYKKYGLPVPTKCPDYRHKNRLKMRNSRKLFDRLCAKCGTAIKTTFPEQRPEPIYCEKCYLQEIY